MFSVSALASPDGQTPHRTHPENLYPQNDIQDSSASRKMAISQAKLKGNLGAIADYFLDVDTDLGDYYLAEDGEPSTAPPRALRPVTGAGASACRLALVRGNVTLHGGRGCASASSGHDTFEPARRSTCT